MYFMRDAEHQAMIEEQRSNQPDTTDEAELHSTGASLEDRMKTTLCDTLDIDTKNAENDRDLLILLELFRDDDNPEDGLFHGQHGDYIMGDGFVGIADAFAEGPNDSQQNINAVLELAVAAKAALGDRGPIHLSGFADDPEQRAMNMYAATLAGVNLAHEADYSDLTPEVIEKMDQAWATMNAPETPEPDMTMAPTVAIDPSVDPNNPLMNPLMGAQGPSFTR